MATPIAKQITSTRRLHRRLKQFAARCERHNGRRAAQVSAAAFELEQVIKSLEFLQKHRPSFVAAKRAAEHPATRAVLGAFPDAQIHSIRFL
jgi:hypothetical protein